MSEWLSAPANSGVEYTRPSPSCSRSTMLSKNANNDQSIEERMRVFAGPGGGPGRQVASVPASAEALAERFGLTEQQVRSISVKVSMVEWPPLA